MRTLRALAAGSFGGFVDLLLRGFLARGAGGFTWPSASFSTALVVLDKISTPAAGTVFRAVNQLPVNSRASSSVHWPTCDLSAVGHHVFSASAAVSAVQNGRGPGATGAGAVPTERLRLRGTAVSTGAAGRVAERRRFEIGSSAGARPRSPPCAFFMGPICAC